MKRIVFAFLVLFAATSLFAGGKECDASKAAKKDVELTGTLHRAASEDGETIYFRVAGDGEKYLVCHKSKAAALKLGADANTTLRVKGKLVSCGEGQELMIEDAKRI